MIQLTVGSRLILGFALVLSMMAFVTVIGIEKVETIDTKMTLINDHNSVKQRYAINFRGSVHDRAIAVRDVVLQETSNDINESITDIRKLEDFYTESAAPLYAMMSQNSSSEEKRILNEIMAIEKSTLPLVEEIIKLRTQGDQPQSKVVLLEDAKPAFVKWLAAINQFIDYQEAMNNQETAMVREEAESFGGVMVNATAISILISFIIVWLLVRNIKILLGGEPHKIAAKLKEMAAGNLSINCESKYENSVLHYVGQLLNQLNCTMDGIKNSAAEVDSYTSTTDKNHNLDNLASQQKQHSQVVIQQMDSVSETAETVESLLGETHDNGSQATEIAQQGSRAVSEMAQEVNNIFNTVNSAVESIRSLEKRTIEISGITETISSISEQTNLLALNAAIEAARAGETGRGFAVVADEVRGLASRTGDATSEISSMLSEVQGETSSTMNIMLSCIPQLERGIKLSDSSKDYLTKIDTQANASIENIKKVVQASTQQKELITSLTQGVTSVIKTATEMSEVSTELSKKNQQVANKLGNVSIQLKENCSYFS